MDIPPPKSIRPGDVIDVRAGPAGPSRRGVVIAVALESDHEPPAYEVAWVDGTATRLYVSDRLVTVVESTEQRNGSQANAGRGRPD